MTGNTATDYLDELLARFNTYIDGGKGSLPQDLLDRFPELTHKQLKTNLTLTDLQYPELQQALAYIVEYTPSKWLLEQEDLCAG